MKTPDVAEAEGESYKFKIDLIVWKLECAEPGDIGKVAFKIDLIVWKLRRT